MADLQSVAHRPGPLKQQNKPHKHGKHKSKGQMSSMTKGGLANQLNGNMIHLQSFCFLKGRVSVKVMAKKARREMRKADRRNQVNDVWLLFVVTRIHQISTNTGEAAPQQ